MKGEYEEESVVKIGRKLINDEYIGKTKCSHFKSYVVIHVVYIECKNRYQQLNMSNMCST